MHRLFITSLAFFLLAAQWAAAQRPVSGKVLDKWTAEPVAGATVFMKKTSVKTTTDAQGQFELIFPNSGELRVRIEMSGYRPHSSKLKEGNDNSILLRRKGPKPFAEGDSTFSKTLLRPITLISETAWHPAQLLTLTKWGPTDCALPICPP